MASMIDLLEAAQAARLPVEVVPDFLTNGHDGVLTLDRPRIGYLHHTVARTLESVYYDPLKRPGWPTSEWRPDVPAPRCNIYVARARTAGCRTGCPFKGRDHVVFVSAGKAHHAGMANLSRIQAARAGQISVRTPDAAGLPDDYSRASFEAVGVEVDWMSGEGWPASLLDLIARLMQITKRTLGWVELGCWIHHRQATYRKPDMDYRGDIWARAAAIDITEEPDMDAAQDAKLTDIHRWVQTLGQQGATLTDKLDRTGGPLAGQRQFAQTVVADHFQLRLEGGAIHCQQIWRALLLD